MNNSDPLAHWRKNLAGEKPPIHEIEPQPGYYKKRGRRDGPYLPASIFIGDDGELHAEIDGQAADPNEIWTWVVKRPVSYEDYKYFVEHRRWPSDPVLRDTRDGHLDAYAIPTSPEIPEVTEWKSSNATLLVAQAQVEENSRIKIGGNYPPTPLIEIKSTENDSDTNRERDEEIEEIKSSIENTRAVAREVYRDIRDAPIATDEHTIPDKCQNVIDLLRRLSRQCDELRKKRKQPYLDITRKIDEYFRELVAAPVVMADKLSEMLLDWQKRDRTARQVLAYAEAKEIEEARRIAAQQATQEALERNEPPPPPPPPTVPEPVSYRPLGGSVTGRLSRPRATIVAKIVDQDLVYRHFRDHADVKDVLQKLANAAIKKAPVPGAEKEIVEKL